MDIPSSFRHFVSTKGETPSCFSGSKKVCCFGLERLLETELQSLSIRLPERGRKKRDKLGKRKMAQQHPPALTVLAPLLSIKVGHLGTESYLAPSPGHTIPRLKKDSTIKGQ